MITKEYSEGYKAFVKFKWTALNPYDIDKEYSKWSDWEDGYDNAEIDYMFN